MADPGIPVIYVDEPADGEKGLFSAARGMSSRIGLLDSADLARNLSAVCEQLSTAFQAAQQAALAFQLDSFEVALDLTAKGEVRLIGSASSEIRGGVRLTFRRRDTPPDR